MKYYVYMLRLSGSDKVYIGQSKDVGIRLGCHTRALVGGYHANCNLQSHYNSTPACEITVDVLYETESKGDVDRMEEFYIKENIGNVFNLSMFARGGGLSCDHPNIDDIKVKMSESQTKAYAEGRRVCAIKSGEDNPNYRHGLQTKEAINNAQCPICGSKSVKSVGSKCLKCLSDEKSVNYYGTLNHFYGKVHSEQTKETISAKFKQRELNGMTNSQPVIVDGVEYCSYAEAGRCLGILKETVRSRAKSKRFPNYQIK